MESRIKTILYTIINLIKHIEHVFVSFFTWNDDNQKPTFVYYY